MLEKTFDKILELGLVFALLAIALGVLYHFWQRTEKKLEDERKARLDDEKAWQVEFKEQEIRHAGELKIQTEENKNLNKARLDNALDMLNFVRSMEDAIKKGDVSKAIEELKLMVRRIAKHQKIDID